MRPGIFVSRTREKLGRTCDQIGRTLEPCNNQMLESSVCCRSKQTSALFLSESSFIDGEEKLHTIAFYFM